MIFKSQTIKTIENMKLSKGVITLLVILGFVLILFFWIKGAYNGMVSKEEQVTQLGRKLRMFINVEPILFQISLLQ